jgi:hypothetical protein
MADPEYRNSKIDGKQYGTPDNGQYFSVMEYRNIGSWVMVLEKYFEQRWKKEM